MPFLNGTEAKFYYFSTYRSSLTETNYLQLSYLTDIKILIFKQKNPNHFNSIKLRMGARGERPCKGRSVGRKTINRLPSRLGTTCKLVTVYILSASFNYQLT
jgi:hypothetical protein